MLLIISLNVLNKGKYDIMILMKILFVCLIVLPFLLFSLYILRYTFKVLNASKKKDQIRKNQMQTTRRNYYFILIL